MGGGEGTAGGHLPVQLETLATVTSRTYHIGKESSGSRRDLLVHVRHGRGRHARAPQSFRDVLDPPHRYPRQIHLDQCLLDRALAPPITLDDRCLEGLLAQLGDPQPYLASLGLKITFVVAGAGVPARPTALVAQGRAKRGASLDPQGFDAGKKITGRKRHILVDTLGLLLSVAVHAANLQDRDGVALVLDRRTRRLFPFIERIYGDGGYQGRRPPATKTGCWTIEIVGRSPTAVGFEVLPKRWIVERTFAWLSRFSRLARDLERYARTVAAFIRLAMTRIMLKRLLANPSSSKPNFADGLLEKRRSRGAVPFRGSAGFDLV